jgi:hypothetical protein
VNIEAVGKEERFANDLVLRLLGQAEPAIRPRPAKKKAAGQ